MYAFSPSLLLMTFLIDLENLESRDGDLSVAGGVSGEKEKHNKKGKKDKGKTKDKPTMMQKLGTFMMMIPVTMQVSNSFYSLKLGDQSTQTRD